MTVRALQTRTETHSPSWIFVILLALACVIIDLIVDTTAIRSALFAIVVIASIASILVGVRRHQPTRRAPWLMLVPAMVILSVGTILAGWFSSSDIADAATALQLSQLIGFPIMFWCLLQFGRTGRDGIDLDALLDALILGAAFGLLAWRVALSAPVSTSDIPAARLIFASLLPVADIVVLVVIGRRMLSVARTPIALRLVTGGLVALSVNHIVSSLSVVNAVEIVSHGMIQGLAYSLLGAAAMHPSMPWITQEDSQGPERFGALRIGVLALALLDTPFLLLLDQIRGERVVDYSILAGSTVISVIVVVRIISLARAADIAGASERSAQQRFRSLVQNSSDLLGVIRVNGEVEYVSPAVQQILGYTPTEAKGLNLADLCEIDDLHMARRVLRSLPQGGVSDLMLVRVRHRSGTWRWLEARLVNLTDDAAIAGTVVNGRDVSDRIAAERSLARTGHQQRAVAQLGREALVATDVFAIAQSTAVLVQATVDAAEAVVVLTGTGTDAHLMHANAAGSEARVIDEVEDFPLAAGGIAHGGQMHLVDMDVDEPFEVLPLGEVGAFAEASSADLTASSDLQRGAVLSVPITDQDGIIGVILVRLNDRPKFSTVEADFIETMARTLGLAMGRRRAEDAAHHQALHDSLTALPNRALFVDRLTHSLAQIERTGKPVAVAFVDIDHFKVVNDSLGHSAGDRILMETARRLAGVLRPGDTVARFGGDEFTLLFDQVVDAGDALAIGERIRAEMARPMSYGGAQMHTTVSIGMAVTSDFSANAESMLRDADAAMYRAKARGRDRVVLFDDTMRDQAITRLRTELDLRRALKRNELRLHYQPVVDLTNGVVTGYEALVRWEHPHVGLILPAEFIPVAEQSGLIADVGRWVMIEAMRQSARWTEATPPGHTPPVVSLNVSARSLAAQGLGSVVADALVETGACPDRMCLEITESALMEDVQNSMATLEHLKELGITLAIDDFGTGYSSLTYLKEFAVDFVKIDASFIAGLGVDRADAAIVSAVAQLAATLDRIAVAEGVERRQQLLELQRLGCPMGQGFLLGRPVPASEIQLGQTIDLVALTAEPA